MRFSEKMIHLGMPTSIAPRGILVEARWAIDAGGVRWYITEFNAG